MQGSYQDTLGFAPVVEVESVWHTHRGYKHFLSMVQDGANRTLRDEGAVPTVRDTPELTKIYRNATVTLGPTENDSRIYDPPIAIKEAVDYAVTLTASRVRMHRRMARMKHQCQLGATQQPRGRNGFERSDQLYNKDTRNYDGAYERYLAHQNALRQRFT